MKEFPVHHCSIHGDSRTHKKALEAMCKAPRENEFYCKICKGMGRKGLDHEMGKQHMKAINVIKVIFFIINLYGFFKIALIGCYSFT